MNYVRHFFQNQGSFFDLLYLWNEVSNSEYFYAFPTQVTYYLAAVIFFKHLLTGKFSRERP